jgi:hypothetical protein
MERMPHYCPICAFHEWNLDGLVEMCWEYLDLVRVYTKPKGKLPDFNEPVVLHRCISALDLVVCMCVWGSGEESPHALLPPISCQLSHPCPLFH